MPQPEITGGIEVVTTTLQFNGDVCQNVLHFSAGSPPTEFGAGVLAEGVSEQWNTHIGPYTHSGARLINISVADMGQVPWLRRDFPFDLNGVGTDEAEVAQVAAVISLRTGFAGRSHRGRIYIGALSRNAITDDGTIEGNARQDLVGYANELSGGQPAGDSPAFLAVYSRKLGTIEQVTSASVDARPDVQRRRANRRLF